MADLKELKTDIKRIYDIVEKLIENQVSEDNYNLDFKKIWFSCKKRPFTLHILEKKEDVICRRYLKILASLIKLSEDKNRREIQVRFLGRILATCTNYEESLEDVVSEGALLTFDSIEEFVEVADEDLRDCLIIDLLLLCYLDGDVNNVQFDFTIGFMSFLGLTKEKSSVIGNIVKNILHQDDDSIIKERKKINIINMYCYFKNVPDGLLVFDIIRAMNVDSEKIIFRNHNFDGETYLNCDEFKAKVIEFDNCSFTGNSRIKSTCEDKEIIIKDCSFSDCKLNGALLYLRNGIITNCTFKNITINTNSRLHLLTLYKCNLNNCDFENITINHYYEKYGGVIMAEKCTMENCNVNKVLTKTNSYDRYKSHNCRYILIFSSSVVSECKFNKCDLFKDSYMFSYYDTKYSELTFENITSDRDIYNHKSGENQWHIKFNDLFNYEE